MITFDEASRRLAELARPLDAEAVALELAWNRVIARPVAASRTAPLQAAAAMDGYAVREADLCGGGPTRLRVVGERFAGGIMDETPLPSQGCVRIFTGAPMPLGADRVVIQEDVVREDDEVRFLAPLSVSPRHVRAPGSDHHAGDVLLERGAVLTPQALVTAAAADCALVEVYRRPRVVILCTGDELVSPGRAANAPGQIPESVSFGVSALARAWGGDVVSCRRLSDDLGVLQKAGSLALDDANVIVTTGGASVGERDLAKAMFAPFGLKLAFEKVAIKPGKPVWLGQVGDRIVLGLPGNPSAAMIAARLFLAPLLSGLVGRGAGAALRWRFETVSEALPCAGNRETFLRASRSAEGVRPLGSQDSSVQRELAATEALIRRPAGAAALATGMPAQVLTF